MSFGKNPYLPKAQAAEQKAADAVDASSRAMAYREAAHQWDRAAARETPGKKRTEYEQNAERNRELADAGERGGTDVTTNGVTPHDSPSPSPTSSSRFLN